MRKLNNSTTLRRKGCSLAGARGGGGYHAPQTSTPFQRDYLYFCGVRLDVHDFVVHLAVL